MEAMTACAIAALTIYDMCKSVDRSMVIGELALWEKTGGRSGVWRRPADGLGGPLVNTPPGVASPGPIEPLGSDAGSPGLDERIDGLLNEARADVDGLL
jgi:hypothetical protein